jgi:ligand-binding sensor domain-containing protein/signal transduction histidine kinase
MQKIKVFIFFLLAIISCNSNNKQTISASLKNQQVQSKGLFISTDSVMAPDVIKAGKPITSKVSLSSEVEYLSIVRRAIKSGIVPGIVPEIKIMGKNGVENPISHKAIENRVFCKAPEVVIAKNAYIKDVNPYNFSSLSKLQGLKHDQIRSIAQDNLGNLWLGTDDGLTKYDGKYFSHYTTDQGLRNNLILTVIHDSKENIWFGTFRGGVTRYDGIYLTSFGTENSGFNDVVNQIYEDKKGNLWFATGEGLTKYDGENLTRFTESNGLCNNDVRAVTEDKSGNIWIGTNGGGVSVFNGTQFTNYSEDLGFVQNYVNTLLTDSYGDVWIGTASNGVVKYNGEFFSTYSKKEGLNSNLIRSILQDSDGNMWFGSTDAGVTKFDGTFLTTYTSNEGLSSNSIQSLLQDRDGNIWFGTRGAGLTRFDGELFTHFTANEGLSNSRVMSILEDREGILWLGTFGGTVTKCRFTDEDGIRRVFFSHFGRVTGLLNNRVYSIYQDRDGNIWFGSDGGGVTKYDGKSSSTYLVDQGLCHNNIRKIFQDSKGNMWFTSYGGGVSKFDGENFTNYSLKSGLTSNNILTVQEDYKGRIWFGTDGGGAICFNGKGFTYYTKEHGFLTNTVYSIIEDREKNLWFGSGGEGVIRYDGTHFTSYSEENGLNNNHVLSLLMDSQNNLWAGTRFGINILKSETINNIEGSNGIVLFKSYNYEDGFLGIGCNLGAIAEDKNGTLWVGTNDRLTAFHGEKRATIQAPNLQITNLQLFNENIPWSEVAENKDTSLVLSNGVKIGNIEFDNLSKWYSIPQKLVLSHKQNYISFSYIGITHTKIQKIKYKYKLIGLDGSWSSATDRTEVSYGNLKPGRYTFLVQAISNEGVWSNEAEFKFIIKPPWWNTGWFYLFLIIVLIIGIYSYIKYRESKLNHDKQLLQQKVDEQTCELRAKNEELSVINLEKDKLYSIIAHDLKGPFSSFLGLTQIMADELPGLTMEDIKNFATSLNTSAANLYNLLENLLQWSRMQQSAIPYTPESVAASSIIKEHMSLLTQTALKKEIEIVYEIPDDLFIKVDRYMFQAVIRNIVSNAIKFTHRGGRVTISAREIEGDMVEISVRDNGIGMSSDMVKNLYKIDLLKNRKGTDGEPSTGLGLLICRDFIEKHGGKIVTESEDGKGSVFYFTVPVSN